MKPGDKLICINDKDQKENILVKDQTYTLDRIGNLGGIFLKETNNSGGSGDNQWIAHKPERFKPLDIEFANDVLSYIKYKSSETI